jgi:hypothetical protein
VGPGTCAIVRVSYRRKNIYIVVHCSSIVDAATTAAYLVEGRLINITEVDIGNVR